MNQDDFNTEFMKIAHGQGCSTIDEMCKLAQNKIEEKQKKLQEADLARVEISNLTKFLKNFGMTIKKSNQNFKEIKENAKFEDLPEETADLTIKVCQYVESNETVRLRDLMRKVGGFKSDYAVSDVVKWLGLNKIISRTEDRSIVKGSRWEDRPKSK